MQPLTSIMLGHSTNSRSHGGPPVRLVWCQSTSFRIPNFPLLASLLDSLSASVSGLRAIPRFLNLPPPLFLHHRFPLFSSPLNAHMHSYVVLLCSTPNDHDTQTPSLLSTELLKHEVPRLHAPTLVASYLQII